MLPRSPEAVLDDGGRVRRRVESHVHWALRHVFRGRMAVDLKSMEARDKDMILDVRVRVVKWTGSVIDEMGESVAGEPPPVDQVHAALYELLDLVPRPNVTGPKGPGIFSPMSNERALALSQMIDRARSLL